MTEIKLTKRYPHSRTEDITDAFMRGYEQGKKDGLKVGKQIVLGAFETYITADRKTEPQTDKDFEVTYTCSFTDCDNFKNFGFGEKCIECKRKQSEAKYKTEPQTERAETMSCQECKWWFTDSLKHGGYCQSLLYNHECRYEPEVDCSWK